jgi:hypothetical protein
MCRPVTFFLNSPLGITYKRPKLTFYVPSFSNRLFPKSGVDLQHNFYQNPITKMKRGDESADGWELLSILRSLYPLTSESEERIGLRI